MAQIPYPTGIKPLVKPVAKPAGNPADRNFFSGSAVPVAPKVAPTVSQVRPTGPTPTNNFFNYTPPASVVVPSQPMSGSPSAMGFNPPYTASNSVNANDRGGDRIQKMPREMMFDPQIQYNLLTKPLAAKYGLEGPASLLNPENYSYNNLQDGISKFGNTLGNVTNLMAYGTPVGAAFAGAGQAANTAGTQGITAPGDALATAGSAAMVTFAVKNILSKGSAAGMAGQTILELTKLAGAFGRTEIVNAVKNLIGVDIGGYIDTAFNADTITNQIPNFLTRPDLQGEALGLSTNNAFKDNSRTEFRIRFVHEFLKRLTPQEKLDVDNAHKAGTINLYTRQNGDTSTFLGNLSTEPVGLLTLGQRESAERGTQLYTEYLDRMKQLLLDNAKQQFDQPIAINLPFINALKVFQDNQFKNIHDPNMTSMGNNNRKQRQFYESAVHDIEGVDPRLYPTYGFSLNPEFQAGDQYDQNHSAAGYGNVTMILKDLIKQYAYGTFGDSAGNGGLQPVRWGSLDAAELEPAIGQRVQPWMFDPVSPSKRFPQYTEAQIIAGLNGVTLDDVERITYRMSDNSRDYPSDAHKEFMKKLIGSGIPYNISALRGRALDD